MIGVQPPDFPYGKGGFEVSGGGGAEPRFQIRKAEGGKKIDDTVGRRGVSPGVISQMNPGPYRPLYLWGWRVGGAKPPSAKGEF